MRSLICLLLIIAAGAGEVWTARPGITVQPDGRIFAGGLHLDMRRMKQVVSSVLQRAGIGL